MSPSLFATSYQMFSHGQCLDCFPSCELHFPIRFTPAHCQSCPLSLLYLPFVSGQSLLDCTVFSCQSVLHQKNLCKVKNLSALVLVSQSVYFVLLYCLSVSPLAINVISLLCFDIDLWLHPRLCLLIPFWHLRPSAPRYRPLPVSGLGLCYCL